VNAQSMPLCISVSGTLTPANARHERLLGNLKRVAFDAGALPFRDELVGWLAEERAAGRRVVLVADGDPTLDQQVAVHLGLFDEVARADGSGSAADRKRRVLIERFGERGFDYAGSDAADLPVWAAARGAVVVGDRKLAERVGSTTPLLRTFAVPQPGIRTWIKAIRLHQWVKNALVFLPGLLAHRVTDPAVLLSSVLAFLAFGCLASSVYLTNDLFDLAADRAHPRKRRRPFDGRRVGRHYDHSFRAHFARGVGHALRMVAARISNHSARNLLRRELQNLVRSAANLEGPDGLQALRLQPDLPARSIARNARKRGAHQRRFHGDGRNARGRRANGFKIDKDLSFGCHFCPAPR